MTLPATAQALFDKLCLIHDNEGNQTYTLKQCQAMIPLINEINEYKQANDVVILAHTYVKPEIIFGIADYVGDSYFLSKKALEAKQNTILFCGVSFMADTAKILNPDKKVIIPAKDGGCTLADCIKEEELKELKKQYPDYTFVCYINTPAVVKANCDVCVTSANVYDIVEVIENDKIYFLTDRLMGENLKNEMQKRNTGKTVKWFTGCCYAHEKFTAEMIADVRKKHPDAYIMAHPECSPDVIALTDYAGSTSQIEKAVAESTEKKFFILSECGLISKLQVLHPDKEFVGPGVVCEYMKTNHLEDILRVMKYPRPEEITQLDEDIRTKAQSCINAMFEYADKVGK